MRGKRYRRYRQAPSPEGLQRVDKGILERYSPQFYANLNTGLVEQYLEEQNVRTYDKSEFNWLNIAIPLLIGSLFVLITCYVGLKIGMATGGTWYIIYIIGIALKWPDKWIKISASVGGSVTSICAGYIFVYTALYILREQGVIHFSPAKTLPIAIAGSILLSVLAVWLAMTLRRLWVIEEPLPLPGFQAPLTLLDIAQKAYTGTVEKVKKTIQFVVSLIAVSAGFVFLRDFPVTGKCSVFQTFCGGRFYDRGYIMVPKNASRYLWANLYLSPMLVAIGWFMMLKGALIICTGALVTWLVINPLAVHLGASAYDPQVGTVLIDNPMLAYSHIGRMIAIGAIVGSGVAALVKTLPKIKGTIAVPATSDSASAISRHIKLFIGLVFCGLTVIFFLSSNSPIASLLSALLIILFCIFLMIVLVKIMGETGSAPVSAMGLIALIALILVLRILGLDANTVAISALLAVTAFCASLSIGSNLFWDFKVGLYVGNHPRNLIKAQLIGILPGTILAGVFISVLAPNLEALGLLAPQAHALAAVVNTLLGAHVNYWLLLAGIAIGIGAEAVTGRGTAFALGMYFPIGLTLPMLFGGVLRARWERQQKDISAEQKSLKLVNTYAMCTGLLIGESVMGAVVCMALLV